MSICGKAQAETTFTVTYKASDKPADGCPDRGAFINSVQRRSRIAMPVGQAEQPDIVFAVEIKPPKKNRVVGKLVITQGIKSSDRVVTGVSCSEVASALSLIAALSIDPNAESLPSLEPLPLPPDPSGPPILGSQPRLITGPAPTIVPWFSGPMPWQPGMIPGPSELDLVPEPLPATPRVKPRHPRDGLDIGFGARFVLDVGPGSAPLTGVGDFLELRDLEDPAWSLRAELSYTVTPTASEVRDLEGDFKMLRGRFVGCIPAWNPAEWFRLWPCAALGGGGEWTKLTRKLDPETVEVAGPWFEIALSARLDFVPAPWLAFELQAGPSLALVRAEFANGSTVFHDPFPLSFGLGVGAAASF